MDSSREFLEMIDPVDEKGIVIQQKVLYEWKPSICTGCRKFGHLKQDCKEGKTEKMV